MFGKKNSAAESMQDISDSLAAVRSARESAQEAATRALKAAERAEAKALKATAKERKKLEKQEAKAAKKGREAAASERKAEMKSAKALAKQAKKADKNAQKAAKKEPQTLFDRATDPKAAKRVITVTKVIGPVVAPFALKAATSTREYLDNRKARQLGVGVNEVGVYRGPTGPVEARLAGLKRSVDELGSRRSGDLQATRFSEVASGRIVDLTAAARAAATMPAGRRRATLSAVSRELDQIDADLMTFLVGK